MTIIELELLCIKVHDGSPDERHANLIKALTAAVRWYAMNTDKRKDDHFHAVTLTDFIEELLIVETELKPKLI